MKALLETACRVAAGVVLVCGLLSAEEPVWMPPRYEVVPQAGHQAAFRIEGAERVRWHFGGEYPRPFFYPFSGPSGESLTRMGHPGAQNHDHHRSIWFAHQKVNGVDFWSDNTAARIRQKLWQAYEDGPEEAVMASQLGWYDGEGVELMEQDLVAALRPGPQGAGQELEIQITLRPASGAESVELGKTNFGLLAVRVAKSLSVHFGGGTLTNSEGAQGEKAIFGQPARWMDYSGPVATGAGSQRRVVTEGITFFDHPANLRHPTKWHVREDGWMGAAFCLDEGLQIAAGEPLELRYLIVAHAGGYDPALAEKTAASFAARGGFTVTKSTRPHRQFDVARRIAAGAR
ncbi:MAG: PmoA family protein [Verrucomicrobiales bacterium]|nr:PmoA family protein [Verrucomicrobiales bacterium]